VVVHESGNVEEVVREFKKVGNSCVKCKYPELQASANTFLTSRKV